MRSLYFIFLMGVILLLQGCTNVEPLNRHILAKNHMKLEPYPLDSKFRRHVYSSREATPGGYGGDPSGCGCK